MIVIPSAILSVVGSVCAASGVTLSAKAFYDSIETATNNRFIEDHNEINLLRFKAVSDKLNNELTALGKEQVTISKNFAVFCDSFAKLGNRPNCTELQSLSFPKISFEQLCQKEFEANEFMDLIIGLESGNLLAGVAAEVTDVAVKCLNKALINNKLGPIFKAIPNNVVVPGAGALAVNIATFGAGAFVQGIVMAYVSSKAKKNSEQAKEQMLKNEKLIYEMIDIQQRTTIAAAKLRQVSVTLCNRIYKPLVTKMNGLVDQKQNWDSFTYDEKQLIKNNILVVQLLNYLISVPIYLTKGNEITDICPNISGVKNTIAKVNQAINNLEV